MGTNQIHIDIIYDNDDRSLVGEELGRATFEEQVLPKIDLDHLGDITVRFPEQVSIITSSFVSGFTQMIVAKYSRDTFLSRVTVEAKTARMVTYFYEDV